MLRCAYSKDLKLGFGVCVCSPSQTAVNLSVMMVDSGSSTILLKLTVRLK